MDTRRVIALGFFDGVHLGHGALLSLCVQRARELGMRTLREDGMLKVASGMTSLAEVLRATMGDAD